jgi:hypothetical protein
MDFGVEEVAKGSPRSAATVTKTGSVAASAELEPEHLREARDANPELRDPWQEARAYRETFAIPEEARAATVLPGDLNRMDALFYSRRPGDQAELAREVGSSSCRIVGASCDGTGEWRDAKKTAKTARTTSARISMVILEARPRMRLLRRTTDGGSRLSAGARSMMSGACAHGLVDFILGIILHGRAQLTAIEKGTRDKRLHGDRNERSREREAAVRLRANQ